MIRTVEDLVESLIEAGRTISDRSGVTPTLLRVHGTCKLLT